MILHLQKLIHAPGERVEFQFEMDLSHVDFGGQCPAQDPVVVTGQVRNIAGMLQLEMEERTVLRSVCDRCLTPFLNPKEISYQCMLAQELAGEEDDEIVLLEKDGTLDVGELLITATDEEVSSWQSPRVKYPRQDVTSAAAPFGS